MTPDQMTELVARLRELALSIGNADYAADLDRAADLIESMAQPEPIATVYYPRTGGNVGVSWRAIPETGAMPPEGAKLYLAPPAREPVAAPLVLAFNEGYMSGHHDTVEACFVNIHPSDMDTYHADVVADLGLSLAPPARKPLSDEQVFADDGIMAANARIGLPLSEIMEITRAVEQAHGIVDRQEDAA